MTLPLFPRVSQRHRAAALFASLAVTWSAGCVKVLPPAPPPPAVVPPIAAAPPPTAGSRLVVDVVEGPAPVQRVRLTPHQLGSGPGRARFRFVETPEVLCPAAPCVADLAPGNVLLGFPVIGDPSALEIDLVHAGPEPSVYRRSLSVYENRGGGPRVLGIVGTSLGGAAAITGTALLPIGLAKDHDGLTVAGGISLAAGAALIAIGVWAIRRYAPIYRPGSSSHFPLTAAPPGGSR